MIACAAAVGTSDEFREDPMLHFTRGATYTFHLAGVTSSHPFYLSTSDVGAGAGVYSTGVTGTFGYVSAVQPVQERARC